MTSAELRAARAKLRLTQKALARALRMGEHGWQSVSAWESGSRDIPGPVAVAVECLLNHGSLSPGLKPTGRDSETGSGRSPKAGSAPDANSIRVVERDL